ncbi:MAG: hypothetical protein EVA89_13130 [Sandaracinaceae bacterium]|nr:MAG: hypothetical protein EVA89_13130 [Sandaracinaceae bacterium]
MSNALEFTGELVGRLCLHVASHNQLGVFAENLPPLSTTSALAAIAAGAADEGLREVRVALLGGNNGKPKGDKRLQLTTDELVANQWRNDKEAREGACTITLVLGPASKLNSLRTAVPSISVRDVRSAAAEEASAWLEQPARRYFWEALAKRTRDIPTTSLLAFAAEVAPHAHRPASLMELEQTEVHQLGLLRSNQLTSAKGLSAAQSAIRSNLKLVRTLEELSDKNRERLIELSEEGDPEQQSIAQAVLRFAATRSRGDLKGLSVDAVRSVLKTKPKKDREDDDGDTDSAPGKERVEGDQLAVDLLLNGARGAKAAAERFAHAIEPDDEGSIDVSEVSVGQRTIEPQPREGTAQSTSLFASLLDEETWGGLVLVPDAQDFVSATKMVAAGDAPLVKFSIRDDDHVRGMLAKGVDVGLITPDALEAVDRYADARAKLLRSQQALIDHPLLALAGDAGLKDDTSAMLAAYGDALAAVKDAAQRLIDSGSVEPGRRLVARMLSLDLVFVQLGDEWQAVAAPTHPFHLWRVHALLDIFQGHLEDLKEIGEDALKAVIADPHTSAPHVVLSPYAVSNGEVSHAHTLTSAGSFGALPMFADPHGRHGGKFRVTALAELAQRLMRLMPHAAIGLRVTLVDPPSVAGTLEKLVSLESVVDDEYLVPLHAAVLRTRPAPEATDEEDQKLATIAKDLVDAGGSLTVRPNLKSLNAVADYLEANPSHLTAVFDPGEAHVVRLGLRPPPLSPLTLPRSYHYDAFDDRIDVVISGDVPLFSAYHDLFCRTIDMPTSDILGRRSGASQSRRDLERITQNTVWLSVVDQGIEPTFRIAGAERLDWRQDAGRDIVTVTGHPETVDGLIRDAMRLAGLPPTEERVKTTVRELFELSGEAILALLRPKPNVSLAEPRFAKGVIGTLSAVRWYLRQHPNALIVSLDDPVSRRWILGAGPDDRHGDLIAIRSAEGGPLLEAIEVKTHDDPSSAVTVRKKTIEGKAVTQVDQTLDILRRVLGVGGSPVAAARRDILRDQLYRAVASRQYQAGERRQFVNVLDELFKTGPSESSGLIFTVKIDAGGEEQSPAAPEYHRSSEGNLVGLVELVETGERRAIGGPAARTPDTSAAPPPPAAAPAAVEAKPAKTKRTSEAPPAPKRDAAPSGDATSDRLRILVGESPTGTEVYWDPHEPERSLNNFGLLVTGDSGAGKTQILRAFIHEVAKANFPICAFDYKNDYAEKAYADAVGLEVYDVNRQGLPFNPLELIPDASGKVQPIRQIHEIAGILGRVFGLGVQMEARLRKAMQAVYTERGIKVRKWIDVAEAPDAPSFDDVVEKLQEDDKNENLLNRLDPLFDLGLFPTTQEAEVSFEDLLQRKVVLLLNGLPNDQIKQALSEFFIVRLHGYALRGEQPRQFRRLLVFDEAWRVADSERLHELAREGRAFGIGIAIGTQFPGDVPDSLSGNLATQLLLLNQSSEHRKSVVRTLLGTTSGRDAQNLENQLQQLQKHEGYFRNQQYAPYILTMTEPHYKRLKGK